MSTSETTSPVARRLKLGLAAIGLLAVGGIGGGAISHAFRPPIEMAPTHIVAIRDLAKAQGIVTVRGRVAESFGDHLVVDDGTGRTLIDGGPHRDGDTLAPLGAVIAVQGRFDRDSFHPSFLVDAAGTVTPLGPPPGRHGHDGHHGHPGPDGDDMQGPDQGPPPPPAPKAPAPAA
ncbi:hypothetical protein [Sphingomonas abietis]|uniref:DNA-binding protein n=1 Tax=Sphingomonas abietis TaxID=3012344 RepID=A0ABY7NSG1_9SPHN|nr:hypothetical protein [Sphingomonas abietis]WBO23730.1 hypothetical protein PBT88_06300 [Sphingomonas abietis]